MKFTIINADVLENILEQINDLREMITDLNQTHKDKALENWLDNQDVCHILNISKRTLQTIRDTGQLPFSKIIRTAYYRPEDVEKLLNNSTNLKYGNRYHNKRK